MKRPLAYWLLIGLGAWLQPFYFAVGLATLLLTPAPSVRAYPRV